MLPSRQALTCLEFRLTEWNRGYAALGSAADGTFLTERIPPGNYEVAAYAYGKESPENALLSGFRGPSHYALVTVEVPADGEVKADELVLKRGGAGK